MADKTFRGRIEALRHNPDESLRFIDGYASAKRDAAQIAGVADDEISKATAAMDPESDPVLPLHERIAVLKMQRDSYADFTEQVAALLGCEGESGSDILDTLKATVDTANKVGNIAAERQRTIDDLRDRLAAAEAELANLRGIPDRIAQHAADDFAGIMDGSEMMPVESDEESRR